MIVSCLFGLKKKGGAAKHEAGVARVAEGQLSGVGDWRLLGGKL